MTRVRWCLGCVLLAAGPWAVAAPCGELVRVETHARSQTAYALAYPPAGTNARAALVLLAGGDGRVQLDDDACPRALKGNSLVRSLPHFHAAGWATALVDAPSDHQGEDGLAGFRASPEHAQDLGRLIADLRARTGLPVWVVGTSRGSISGANAAARLAGAAAPDGVVLTSVLTVGATAARKPWVAQTVFDLPLQAITLPVLLIGHAEDRCPRSPASAMAQVAQAMRALRHEIVTVPGPAQPGLSQQAACEGRSPHGYIGQEAEVVEAMARFIAQR